MDLPHELDGYGAIEGHGPGTAPSRRGAIRRSAKLRESLEDAIAAAELRDGATVSFHHHLRNGDGVLNVVMDALARRGLRNLHVAATSIFPVHAPLVGHMRTGTVARLSASFIAGPVGDAVSRGVLCDPVVLRTHGGRARALATGALAVDAAFVAAPAADDLGNVSGRAGRTACGPLGYPLTDVDVARHVIAVTDNLVPFPAAPVDISQHLVDSVVAIDSIGDAAGIGSGTTLPAADAVSLGIAEQAAAVVAASGLLTDGFSFQTGAGSVSLATAAAVGREMAARGVIGSFCSGGITGFHVDMLNAGLFRTLMDVQSFDLKAVRSYASDPRHLSMSAATYAGPHIGGAVVDRVDAVVLGAAEIDLDFNVNVTTKAGGIVIGGSGGHADTAAGARLAIVTTRLTANGYPKIVPAVGTVTTPGATIDAVVTDAGIAVNPGRSDLAGRLAAAGLPVMEIGELAARAAAAASRKVPPRSEGPVVAVSEYRDGTVTDVVRRIAPEAGG